VGIDSLCAKKVPGDSQLSERLARQLALQRFSTDLTVGLPPFCQFLIDSNWDEFSESVPTPVTREATLLWLNELVEFGANGLQVTRLAREIYESRHDLQSNFPDQSRHHFDFVRWFVALAPREFRLGEELVAPMRRKWEELLQDLPSEGARLRERWRVKATALRASFQGFTLRDAAEDRRCWTPRDYLEKRVQSALSNRPFGLNLVGLLSAPTGLGESSRLLYVSARRCSIPVAVRDITDEDSERDPRVDAREGDCSYHFNLHCYNADTLPSVARKLGEEFFRRCYNIGYWAWELPEFPTQWMDSFQYLQEIWVPSQFCQDAIALKAPIPVVRMPMGIEVGTDNLMTRQELGFPTDEFVFLTVLDAGSVFERKNPLAVMEAFKTAFQNDPKCRLVVKVSHIDQQPHYAEVLREHCAGSNQISIVDRVMRRREVNSLINASDCLVSLHRAEGFGLAIAEAMFLGTPVIVTAYSGNMEFTHPDNSLLVKYRLQKVGKGNPPFHANSSWAEPSFLDAVEQMKKVRKNAELRNRIGAAGQAYVRSFLSPEVVGQRMAERLLAIHWSRFRGKATSAPTENDPDTD